MKNKKHKTFIFEGLGFPIKLINAPMIKDCDEWHLDVDMNKLMRVVIEALVYKSSAFSADEIQFIRTYLQMTTKEFGKMFGVSHIAVLRWENGKNKIAPSLEFYIRLFVLDRLHVKDSEFRNFYKETSLQEISQKTSKKVHPLIVDAATEHLKVAL